MKRLEPQATAASRRLNRLLTWLCIAAAVALPVLTLAGAWSMTPADWYARSGLGSVPAGRGIAPWQTGTAALVGTLPAVAMSIGLLAAARCFRAFTQDHALAIGTVRDLRRLATGVMAAAILELAVQPLLGLLLTWNAGVGQRALTLSIGSQPVLLLLFAAIVRQIAHVMTRAVELAEEHAQIV